MKYIPVVCVVLFALLGVAFGLKDPVCGLPPAGVGDDQVNCLAAFEIYIYHADTNSCKFYIYGGCGGNDNSFDSLEECEAMCKE